MKFRIRTLVALVAAFSITACSALPLKERIAKGMQAAHQTIGEAQDAEISVYNAGAPQVTVADHKRFHAALVGFFDAEIKLGGALRAWRAGDPPPQSVREAITVAQESLAEAVKLAPPAFASVLSIVSGAIAQLANLITLIDGGKAPLPTAADLDRHVAAFTFEGGQ